MITTPSTDIALSEKQSRQLEVGLQKLSNIEAEIAIAARNLRVLKDDVMKATLEFKELEEKRVSLSDEVENLQKNKIVLEKDIVALVEALQESKKLEVERNAVLTKKESELSERENRVSASESELALSQEKKLEKGIAIREIILSKLALFAFAV